MVWRIRKVLRLQTKCGALRVGDAAFSVNRAVQEISRIELSAGLGRPDFQYSPARSLLRPRGEREAIGLVLDQDEIVVVALAEFQLLIIGIDPRSEEHTSELQ